MPTSGAFLQSRGWEAFQKSLGKDVRRFDGTLMIKQQIGLGMHYWYCPRGLLPDGVRPVFGHFDQAIFWRFDSAVELSSQRPEDRPDPIRLAPHNVQPPTTIILDLNKSEEQLLQAMHQKTRYNIKVAQRHRVSFRRGGQELLETFWQLLTSTTERNTFRAHPKSYYQKLLQPHDDPELKTFVALATVDNQPAAAALMIDFHGVRTYLHGASNYHLRESMAPYALHWQLIREAKKQGMTAYDFWGIAVTDNPQEPLAGVTRFKKGWGGDIFRYPQTVDIIFKPIKYRFYRLVHWLLVRC